MERGKVEWSIKDSAAYRSLHYRLLISPADSPDYLTNPTQLLSGVPCCFSWLFVCEILLRSSPSFPRFLNWNSPIFGQTSDLSPARPYNEPLRLGLNSRRHQIISLRFQRTPLMRTLFTELLGATVSAQDGGWCNNSLPPLNGSGNDQIEHPSAYPGKFFADTMNMDFVDPNNSSISVRKQSERIDRLRDDVAGRENMPKLGHEYDTRVKVGKAAFAPHATMYQDPGVSMTEAFLHHEMPRIDLQFEDAQNKLETNWHSHICSDDEVVRSLSSTRPKTPFNTNQSIPYRTPTMSVPKSVNVKSAQMGSFSLQEMLSKPLFKPVAESLLREDTDDNNLKSLPYYHLTKSPNKFGVWNPLKDPSTQVDKNKRKAEDFGDEEEFYRSDPKKGRQVQKQKPKSRSGDSCIISCRCKKSKCMKLYCECFAARVYCAETCSCQGCLNVKESDDEILEARELIESRNPLAPKVVHHSIEPSAIGYGEDGTRLSSSSARHIKGCNCKRSMCVKKYCGCYQSKVRCSDGCHCEGCQNVYGQREEKGIMNGPLSGEENNQRTDLSFLDRFNTPAPTNTSHYTYIGTDQITTPYSTPLSPQVLCSTQEEEPNIWSSLEQYLPSPEFRLPIDKNDSVFEIAKETTDTILSTQEPDLGIAETTDEFEFPIPVHKPEPNYMEWTNSSTPRFPSGYIHPSCASPNWHRSRIFPVFDFRGNKLNQVDAFEHEFNKILKNDQPETLEDTSMSLNTVKVSTQNKKRVCPPDPVQEFGSTPPVGSLKSVTTSPVQQMKDPQRSRWQQMSNTISSNLDLA